MGAEHSFARFHHKGGDHGGDAQLQVIGAQLQALFAGTDEDALQGRDGGFCGDGPLDIADSFGNIAFIDGKFHRFPFPASWI